MAKRIYPGNYVNRLSAYQNQCAVLDPGRQFYAAVGYALITSTGALSWPVVIPSPDLRGDDKPRLDIPSLVIPAGACVYSVGLRVPDVRRDRGDGGTARSLIVGTNTDRLKVADVIGSDNTFTTATLATNSAGVVVASTTIAPVASRRSIVTPVILAGALTLRVFSTATGGTTAGSVMSSTNVGGTPIIVEVDYHLDDDLPEMEDVRLPFLREN